MYLPAHFEENRHDVLIDLIQKHSLGCLITHVNGELDANHLPFEYAADQHVLLAHIAKNNPLYSRFKQAKEQSLEVLVVFSIDHAYVSPNWYTAKFEHHRAVPTWNYVVIHAKGKACLIEDEKVLRGILAKLTRRHETAQLNKSADHQAWRMSDAPKDYIQDQLSQIVAIQIEIDDLIGKFKLSQNRSDLDVNRVAQALADQDKKGMSELMLRQLSEGI